MSAWTHEAVYTAHLRQKSLKSCHYQHAAQPPDAYGIGWETVATACLNVSRLGIRAMCAGKLFHCTTASGKKEYL